MTGFESKRQAAQAKLDDDADTLSIVYQRGFADGKRAAQPEQEPVAYDKTELNRFVQSLYDEKMQKGKHGHYETLFHVVHQAIKKVAPPKQQAEPIGFITSPGPITQYTIPTQRPWQGLTKEAVELNEAVISAWRLREVYFDEDGEPLMHRSPPAAQRPWQGLTEEEAKEIYSCIHGYESDKRIARAVEAKLKERNT